VKQLLSLEEKEGGERCQDVELASLYYSLLHFLFEKKREKRGGKGGRSGSKAFAKGRRSGADRFCAKKGPGPQHHLAFFEGKKKKGRGQDGSFHQLLYVKEKEKGELGRVSFPLKEGEEKEEE